MRCSHGWVNADMGAWGSTTPSGTGVGMDTHHITWKSDITLGARGL